MPTSNHYQLTPIMDLIIKINPDSILDIGIGFGKYGVLCREYLELWDGREEYTFKRKLDGVEIFADYITPLHNYIYDTLYIENVFNILDKLTGYDLVLIIGTLEHFDKEQGYSLLKASLKNKNIIVSTPNRFIEQKGGFGNPHEEHKTSWTHQELESTLGKVSFHDTDYSIICLK